jgi:hypothetical protein
MSSKKRKITFGRKVKCARVSFEFNQMALICVTREYTDESRPVTRPDGVHGIYVLASITDEPKIFACVSS